MCVCLGVVDTCPARVSFAVSLARTCDFDLSAYVREAIIRELLGTPGQGGCVCVCIEWPSVYVYGRISCAGNIFRTYRYALCVCVRNVLREFWIRVSHVCGKFRGHTLRSTELVRQTAEDT